MLDKDLVVQKNKFAEGALTGAFFDEHRDNKKPLVVGLPRALMYYSYGILWERFFDALGAKVVVSPETDRDIFEEGEAYSIDECCLASKVYLGHVKWLESKVDYVFVPAFITREHRRGFCTKHQSLPDLVRNTFPKINVLSCEVGSDFKRKDIRESYVAIARELGVSPAVAAHAYKLARAAQEEHDSLLAKAAISKIKNSRGIKVALVAHPYIARDKYISGMIERALSECGAEAIAVCDFDEKTSIQKSFEITDTMPWATNRRLCGGLLQCASDIDGAILVSAFPCGPDSLANELISHKMDSFPILKVVLDGQSGEAGLQTRIESFIDILTFQKKGGYLHE
jgi:predicted nucleotide-binding protein (sugar kinase/HSP70/actin superfamily)